MPPWSPAQDHPEPESAPGLSTPGPGFLPRLDYYLKLAEGPALPDDASTGGGESLVGVRGRDTPMVDPDLEASPSLAAPQRSHQSSYPRAQPGSFAPQVTRGRLHTSNDGRKIFYGQTSLFNLLPPTLSTWNSQAPPRFPPPAPLMPFEQRDLEDSLTESYFLYDNLFVSALLQRLYLRDKGRYESGDRALLYSPALGHAILAVGALYTEEEHASVEVDLSDHFSSRARDLLNQELSAPRLSTILTLVVLCSLSAANAKDSQGWVDSGLAFRLIYDIGLDQPNALSHPMESAETLLALQQETLKGVVALDSTWRNWLGRPPEDEVSQLLTTQDYKTWNENSAYSLEVSLHASLMAIQRDILRHKKYPNEEATPVEANKALERWRDDDGNYARGEVRESIVVMQSRMHCSALNIQLHRVSDHSQSCIWARSAPAPCSRCSSIAYEIASQRQSFKEEHGLRKLNPFSIQPLLIGSLTEVFRCFEPGQQGTQTRQQRQDIWKSIQAFVEVAETMSAGSRALEIVMAAQREGPPRFG